MWAWVEYGDDGAPYLRIGKYIWLRCPDNDDRNPRDWWNIEAITAIPGIAIATAWAECDNPVLARVLTILQRELSIYHEESFTTVEQVRSVVIYARVMRGDTEMPCLFTGRMELLVNRTRRLLEDVHGKYLFVMLGKHHEQFVPAILNTVRDRLMIDRVDDAPGVMGLFIRAIRWSKPAKMPRDVDLTKAEFTVGTTPHEILVHDFIRYPPSWPELDGIVRTPTIRADGSVNQTVGYDHATRAWYQPDPDFVDMVIPDNPSPEQVEWAKRTLVTPFAEFPLVDGFGPALAPLFEQLMLPMIGLRPKPLYVVEAPPSGQRSGKSLLANGIGCIINGYEQSSTSKGTTEEELEKRITSALRAGDLYNVLDNVSHHVSSDALAMLITCARWRSRVLGQTRVIDIVNRGTWVLTLNGGSFSRDIAKRTILIRLDVRRLTGLSPDRRVFSIADLPGFLILNRGRIIQATLILIRSWVAAGCPNATGLVGMRGGFERWISTVAACVTHAGFGGLREAILSADDRDADLYDDRMLVAHWTETFGMQWIPASQAATLAKANGLYEESVFSRRPNDEWAARRMVKHVLSRLVQLGIVREGGRTHSKTYQLTGVPVEDPSSAIAATAPVATASPVLMSSAPEVPAAATVTTLINNSHNSHNSQLDYSDDYYPVFVDDPL